MVQLKFETNLSNSLTAIQSVASTTEKVTKGFDNAAKEARKLEAAAKRIIESNETPLERYVRQVERLGEMQIAGALSSDKAARALTKYTAELDRARTGFVSLSSVEQSAKRITAEHTAEMLKAERAMVANQSAFVSLASVEKSAAQVVKEHAAETLANERAMVANRDAFVSLESVERSAISVMKAHTAEVVKAEKAQDNERSALERAAATIKSQNMTALEAYNKKVADTNALVKAGVLTQGDATRAIARYKEELDKAGQSSRDAFGSSMLSSLKSYVMGVASIGTAISVVRSEMEAIKRESEKTTQAQMSAAQARSVLKKNMSSLSREEQNRVLRVADEMSGETGMTQQAIDLALAEAQVADNPDNAFARVRLAARVQATEPEKIGTYAGALSDISKSIRDPNPMRAHGFLQVVGGLSRVTDDQKVADWLPPTIANTLPYGMQAEESGAMFDALSNAIADTEGRVTKTAVIRLAEQLRNKVKGSTFEERLARVRANPRAGRKFLNEASFEAQASGAMEEFILNANSPISRDYERYKTSFGTPQDQISKGQGNLSFMEEGRIATTAAVERTIKSRTNQFRISNGADLTNESREEILERKRELTRYLDPFNRVATWFSSGPTMSTSEAIDELEFALKYRERNSIMPSVGPADPRLIENTQKMIDELKALRNQQAKQSAPRPSGRQE